MLFVAVHESGFGTNLPSAAVQNYVRFLRYSGREMLALRLSHFDPIRTSAALANGSQVRGGRDFDHSRPLAQQRARTCHDALCARCGISPYVKYLTQ
jgi:hypothetical protein